MSDGTIEIATVGAIRLALDSGASDEAILSLTRWFVDCAPPTLAEDTQSVRLFIDGIRALGFSVSTEPPSGVYAPVRGDVA